MTNYISIEELLPSAQEDPDLSFVTALKAGQDQALNALMDRHRKGVFNFVYRHIPNEADAHELTAEAFVRAYFNIGRFRPSAKFVTWLYQIALNLCRDHLKSRAYEGREELSALEKAISELPEDLKNPLILTALEGYSQAEAAELLGISQKAVEMKIYRARKLLLEKMSKIGF